GGTQQEIGIDHVDRLLKEFKDPNYVKHILERTQIWDTRPGKKGIKSALDNLTPEAKARLEKTSASKAKSAPKSAQIPNKKLTPTSYLTSEAPAKNLKSTETQMAAPIAPAKVETPISSEALESEAPKASATVDKPQGAEAEPSAQAGVIPPSKVEVKPQSAEA